MTAKTAALINHDTLTLLQPAAILVNASRGAVVDQAALIEFLQAGRIAGAALDVFEDEPLPAHHPITELPHVVLTPHIAGLTTTSMERTAQASAQAVLDALVGKTPEYVVNGVTVG